MSRQLLGLKKINKLREETGLDVVACLVRGGTDHRKDLCLADGSVLLLFRDKSITKANSTHSFKMPIK